MLKKVFSVKKERGQALVEMSVSMTALLILLVGIADLGRAFFTYITLRDAAQEGALYATYAAVDCAGIEDRVRDHASVPVDLSDSTTVTVTTEIEGVDCSAVTTDICAGNEVSVLVAYPSFQLATPFLGALIGTQTLNLRASVIDTVIVDQSVSCP